jgi:hypothetical protein
MDIDHEEIFGPILPIMTYDDIDEVTQRINARPKPLALYIFDKSRERAEQIITATSSGSVGINLTVAQFTHTGLPFGGVNTSGMGAAHGHDGFRAADDLSAIHAAGKKADRPFQTIFGVACVRLHYRWCRLCRVRHGQSALCQSGHAGLPDRSGHA